MYVTEGMDAVRDDLHGCAYAAGAMDGESGVLKFTPQTEKYPEAKVEIIKLLIK